jgi:putative ABC transport system permease protein
MKNKSISIINVIGLSVSFMLLINLLVWVQNEFGFDRFHLRHDRIYRILTQTNEPGKEEQTTSLCQGHLPGLISDIPQIEQCIRLNRSEVDVEINNVRLTHFRILYADSAFFRVFTFGLLYGNENEIVNNPASIAVTNMIARRLFGEENAIGKVIKIDGKDCTIKGVLRDIPSNSHLQFDILSGFNKQYLNFLTDHSGNEFYTYVLLRDKINKQEVFSKIADRYSDFLKSYFKNEDSGTSYNAIPQMLTDIELHSDNIAFDVAHGNMKDIWLASGLIIFILLIAGLNFINLQMVSAESRLKEIGLRKIVGATRTDLIIQFIGEAFMISFFSLIIAMTFLSGLILPYFAQLTGKQLSLVSILDPAVIYLMIFICFFIGFMAGAYPAMYLSQKTIAEIVSRAGTKGLRINPFMKGLVLAQFTIVMFLITCMIGFYKQIDFIRSKDLGFNKEQVIALDGLSQSVIKKYKIVQHNLLQNDKVGMVCLAQGINVKDFSGQIISRVGVNSSKILTHHTRTSSGFLDIFQLKLAAGRDFDSTMVTDKKNFILNEAAIKSLGFDANPIDQPVVMWDTGLVIGVVKDFNFDSMHKPVEPLVITLEDLRWGYIFVRLKPGFRRSDLDFIGNTIRSVDPLYTLEYQFVDDSFNSMYQQENNIGKILNLAVYVSIIIAFMGLLAITTFIIIRKIKEIGIRKINGADRFEILFLLNRDYLRWISYSFLISTPFAVFALNTWLNNFAFKTHLGLITFILSGLIVLIISVCTVSIICWNAASKNPVETLRYE